MEIRVKHVEGDGYYPQVKNYFYWKTIYFQESKRKYYLFSEHDHNKELRKGSEIEAAKVCFGYVNSKNPVVTYKYYDENRDVIGDDKEV